MNAAALIALAERCEQAEGPSRELDIAIGLAALNWRWVEDEFNYSERWQILDFGAANHVGWYVEGLTPDCIPSPTASIDAAMTLVPEGWRVIRIGEEEGNEPGKEWRGALVTREGRFGRPGVHTNASTPALAICSAALRARAASCDRSPEGSETALAGSTEGESAVDAQHRDAQ